MRHRTLLATCALLAVATSGCEKIKGLLGRKSAEETPPAVAQTDRTQQDTTAAAPTLPPAPPVSTPPVEDVPYESADTGTIAPGMAERDVYMLWGPPAAVRRAAEHTYLYFPNGCEKTCGTMDLVILENGLVVDAIVRWPGHGYSGESSSPPGRVPFPTRDEPPASPTPTPEP